MKRPILFSLCASFALGTAPTRIFAQDTSNAALLYYQGCLAADPLDQSLRKELLKSFDQPIDEKATAQILHQWGFSLEMIKKAAEKPECNWGIDPDAEGVQASQYSWLEELARAFRLRMLLRLRHGDTDGATDDLITVMRVSKHAGEPAVQMTRHCQYVLQLFSMYWTAQNLPKFSDTNLSRLAETLKTLSTSHSVAEIALNGESRYMDRMNKLVRQSLDKHETTQQAAWYQSEWGTYKFDSRGKPHTRGLDACETFVLHATMEEYAQAVAKLPQDYDEMIRLLEMPDPQARPALREFMERARDGKSASPLGGLVFYAL